jgi:hypothetical protein
MGKACRPHGEKKNAEDFDEKARRKGTTKKT